MSLFRRVRPPFNLKALQRDPNVVLIQDPSAVWGVQDFLPRRNLLTYSEDFSNTAWIKANSGTGILPVVTANYGTAPDGTLTADRVELSLGGGSSTSDVAYVQQSYTAGGSYVFSIYLKSNTSNVVVSVHEASSSANHKEVTVTTEWTRFTYTVSVTSPNSFGFRLRGGHGTAGTADVLAWGAQLTRADTIDQSYQRITDWTTEQYAHAAQKSVPWLRRNRFLNTSTLSTQTVSSVTASPITVSFKGTGTITFSTAYSGSLVGTGANDRVTATFTPAAGNLVCTVSGTVTEAQCENGSAATGYQPILASWGATYTALAQAAGYPISMYADRAGTTATDYSDVVVGKLLDLSGDNNHATAPSDAARPLLKQDGNGKWYLLRDGVDDNLPITFPNLGSNCVTYVCDGTQVIKTTGVTLNGAHNTTTPTNDYGRIYCASPPTAAREAQIIKYLKSKAGIA